VAEGKLPLYHIYCDESRQTADRYMVIGGIISSAENVHRFDDAMALYRDSQNMHAELKWTKVSNQKLAEYRSLIDLFFTFTRAMHFKSMVLESGQIDYKTYHRGDRELGFYKFIYQMLLHQFGPYTKEDTRYLVILDRRTSSYKLSALYTILNRGLRKKYNFKRDVITKIEDRDSKKCNALQVVDVLIGAVGYHWNGCHTRTNAKRGKVLLAEYIAQKVGLVSLAQETPRRKKEFSIWHFKLRQKKTP